MSILKRTCSQSFIGWVLVASACGGAPAAPSRPAIAASPSAWTVELNEGLDALILVNAISQDPLYAPHYAGLRNEWTGRMGAAGTANADAVFKTVSMSGTARLLFVLGPRQLADVVTAFAHYSESRGRIVESLSARGGGTEYERQDLAALDQVQRPFLDYLVALKKAGFSEDWKAQRRPSLEQWAAVLRTSLDRLPVEGADRTLSRFLGINRRPVRHVVLLYYASPISFRLPGAAMATECPRPTGLDALVSGLPWIGGLVKEAAAREMARRFALIALHESLHEFPRSADALARQDNLLAKNPDLSREYAALRRKWHEGPEEYFVVAAEAYLSEAIGLRDHGQALSYVRTQNGGMTLSATVYEILRNSKPDARPDWTGYGDWLVKAMQTGVIR
jgi:hypothetical protein